MYTFIFFLFYFSNLIFVNGFVNTYPSKIQNYLKMGCDYYITTNLNIYYNNVLNNDVQDFSIIELKKERGYYYYPTHIDEDDDDFENSLLEYIEEQLMPKMPPILIYYNGTFKNSKLENKYFTLVNEQLKYENREWKEINKIIKDEFRWER